MTSAPGTFRVRRRGHVVVLALAGCLLATPAPVPGDVCTAMELLDASSMSAARDLVERLHTPRIDSRHWLTAAEMQDMRREGGSWVLVDVRDRPSYEASRIPGSIHVPIARLRHVALPASTTIVLVADAVPEPVVRSTLHRALQVSRGSMYLLTGGVLGWRQSGGELTGNPSLPSTLGEVSPSAYHASRSDDGWLVVRFSDDAEADSAWHDQATHLLVRGGRADVLRKKVAGAARTTSGTPGRHVLLVDDSGEHESLFRALARETTGGLVSWLDGGADAYHRYVDTQRVVVAGRRRLADPPRGRCPS